MAEIVKFCKFYIKQLWSKAWFLIGFVPAIIDIPSFWIGEEYLSTPYLQEIILFKWQILFASILLVHIYIIYQTWKQPKDGTVVPTPELDETLSYRQTVLLSTVEKILSSRGITTSSFSGRYKNGFQHLSKEDVTHAASEYYAAFLQIESTLLDRSTYNNGRPNVDLLGALRNGLSNLKVFSDEARNDVEELRNIVASLENAVGSLSAYIL